MGFFSKIAKYTKEVIGLEEIKRNNDWIKDMASKSLSPKRLISTSRVETFDQAVQRHRATPDSLFKNYKNFELTFHVSMVMAGLCTLFSLKKSFNN